MARYNFCYKCMDCAIYDYRGLQAELEEMAAKGWRLDRVTNYGIWRYRAAEPAKVRYEITYVADAAAELPNPTDSELEMEDLCAAAGWVKAASLAQMQIYCNEDPEALPLETDEAVRLRSIQKAMKKGFVPGRRWALALLALQIGLRLWHMIQTPVEFLTSRACVYLLGLVSWCFLAAAGELGLYGLWSRTSEKEVAEGFGCVSQRGYRWVRRLSMACSLIVLLGMAWVYSALLVVLLLGGIAGILILFNEYGAHLKTRGRSSDGSAVAGIVMILLFSVFLGRINVQPKQNEIPDEKENMILTVEELTGAASGSGYGVADLGNTPLASETDYRQEFGGDRISYTVVEVKCPLLRTLCIDDMEAGFRRFKWNLNSPDAAELAPQDWNAEQVWHCEDEGCDRWLLVYEDRIVDFSADWPLTDAQQEILAEAFAP